MSTIEVIGDITVDHDYWDCGCKERYIHHWSALFCPKCGSIQAEQPNSRINEIKEQIPSYARKLLKMQSTQGS